METTTGQYLRSLAIALTYVCLSEPRSVAQTAAMPETDEYHDLRNFRLDQPGKHVFHFRQTQRGEMYLLLEVQGPVRGERERQELTQLELTIEVALVNHKGQTVCHAVGSPRNGVTDDSWIVTTGGGGAAFWHRSCTDIKMNRSQYTLTVLLRDVGPKTPKVIVTPIFARSDNFGP